MMGLFSRPKRVYRSGLELIQRIKLNNQNDAKFWLPPDINHFRLLVNGVVFDTNAQHLIGRFSINRGSWDAGSASYGSVGTGSIPTTSFTHLGYTSTTSFFILKAKVEANYAYSAICDIYLNSRGVYSQFTMISAGRDNARSADEPEVLMSGGMHLSTRRPVGLQVIDTGGLIVSGELGLY